MTLSSQSPRDGASRQYMFRKRRRRRWPLVALLLTFVVLAVLLLWKNPKSETTIAGDGTSADEAQLLDGLLGSDPSPQPGSQPGSNSRDVLMIDPITPQSQELQSQEPQILVRPGASAPGSSAPGNAGNLNAETAGGNSANTTNPLPTAPGQGAFGNQETTSAYGRFRDGKTLIEKQKLVLGRQILSALLFTHSKPIPDTLADDIRTELDRANQTLIFSPTLAERDDLSIGYKVQSGDRLSRIAPRYGLTSKFVAQINGIDPNRIRVGQTLKIIQGPLHARVIKHRFLMDIYANDQNGQPIYIKSYRVGLGTDDSTPIGSWRVEPGRKAINPDWRDDRTNQYYASNNPENPIGEYWLALEGTDAITKPRTGYGIHGTIDPDSIGTMASRGCIRLRDEDIAEVYNLLVEGDSTVHVVP